MQRFCRHRAAQYAGLLAFMVFWSWLGMVALLYSADRIPLVAVPINGLLAAMQYVGITFAGRSWTKGAIWVLGDVAGTTLGFYT